MRDDPRSAIAGLTARLALQEREMEALRARHDRPCDAAPRRWRRPLVVLVVALVIAIVPVAALASHQFSDVPDSSSYHADIDAIADAGVTTGCGGGKYCPQSYVTREQMAAFMNRLGALQAGKTPVVNATKLDGIDSSGFLRSGTVVVHQSGPWNGAFAAEDSLITISRTALETQVLTSSSSDSAGIVMPLNLPASIAGTTYGFKSAKICYAGVAADSTLFAIYVTEIRDDGSASEIADETERDLNSTACVTITQATPTAATGGTMLRLFFFWNSSGTVFKLRNVTVTWVPAS